MALGDGVGAHINRLLSHVKDTFWYWKRREKGPYKPILVRILSFQ